MRETDPIQCWGNFVKNYLPFIITNDNDGFLWKYLYLYFTDIDVEQVNQSAHNKYYFTICFNIVTKKKNWKSFSK